MMAQPLGASVAGELNRRPAGRLWNGWFRQNQSNFWNNSLYKYVRYFGLESENSTIWNNLSELSHLYMN